MNEMRGYSKVMPNLLLNNIWAKTFRCIVIILSKGGGTELLSILR